MSNLPLGKNMIEENPQLQAVMELALFHCPECKSEITWPSIVMIGDPRDLKLKKWTRTGKCECPNHIYQLHVCAERHLSFTRSKIGGTKEELAVWNGKFGDAMADVLGKMIADRMIASKKMERDYQ